MQRQTLIVYVVAPDSASLSKANLRSVWDPILRTYKRLHPDCLLYTSDAADDLIV